MASVTYHCRHYDHCQYTVYLATRILINISCYPESSNVTF
ncbi:unnamed protein product [Schistosoma mattheei]|uniref:Uncharacterized protein n=1 Tax=Schistosoma mattheei TaxID=31246 RepID=A0A3P8D7B9_9TREM|nr:unnamed protein product [Schistosoma mattheei]